MIKLIRKSDQFNDIIFGGRFYANKPVFNGKENVKPYSNIYYWSNGYVKEDCEFGLHPHEGFEIMTFLFDGKIEHYDTESKVWTPLHPGDFQIIQSNSGIKHQEKISKGSRAFQIWFDPNFREAVKLVPSYIDYHAHSFPTIQENGIEIIQYLGKGSSATALTPNLSIKKLMFNSKTHTEIILNELMCYTFYVLKGKGVIGDHEINTDDALRISNELKLSIDFEGELFYIENPAQLDYEPIWE